MTYESANSESGSYRKRTRHGYPTDTSRAYRGDQDFSDIRNTSTSDLTSSFRPDDREKSRSPSEDPFGVKKDLDLSEILKKAEKGDSDD